MRSRPIAKNLARPAKIDFNLASGSNIETTATTATGTDGSSKPKSSLKTYTVAALGRSVPADKACKKGQKEDQREKAKWKEIFTQTRE